MALARRGDARESGGWSPPPRARLDADPEWPPVDGMRRALNCGRSWCTAAAGLSEAEADGMRLPPRVTPPRQQPRGARGAREQSAANQSAASRLKAERRQAAAARRERDEPSQRRSEREAAEARRREGRRRRRSPRRSESSPGAPYAHAKEERQHSEQLRDTRRLPTSGSRSRGRRAAGGGALAQELESLGMRRPPQRPSPAARRPRDRGARSLLTRRPKHLALAFYGRRAALRHRRRTAPDAYGPAAATDGQLLPDAVRLSVASTRGHRRRSPRTSVTLTLTPTPRARVDPHERSCASSNSL